MTRLWLSNATDSVQTEGCLPNAVNSVQMGGGAFQMLQIACKWKVWEVEWGGTIPLGGVALQGPGSYINVLYIYIVYIYIHMYVYIHRYRNRSNIYVIYAMSLRQVAIAMGFEGRPVPGHLAVVVPWMPPFWPPGGRKVWTHGEQKQKRTFMKRKSWENDRTVRK